MKTKTSHTLHLPLPIENKLKYLELITSTELTGNVSGLTGDVSGLTGEVYGLRGDVSGLRGNLYGLRGNLYRLRGNVSGLTGNVSGLTGGVYGLTGDVTKFQRAEYAIEDSLICVAEQLAFENGEIGG